MKQYKFSLTILIVITLIVFQNCRKAANPPGARPNLNTLAYYSEEFSPGDIGTLHNSIIDYLDQNLDSPPSGQTMTYVNNATITLIGSYNTTNSLDIDPAHIDDFIAIRDGIYTEQNYATLDLEQLAEDYLDPLTTAMITSEEKDIIISLFAAIEDSKGLSKANAYTAISSAITTAQNAINALNLNDEAHEGYISNIVINVASNSLEYWDDYDNPITNALPVWVGLDAVGAIAAGGASLLSDYANNQPLNWKTAGAWALGGAVGSLVPSTRWFKKFFY